MAPITMLLPFGGVIALIALALRGSDDEKTEEGKKTDEGRTDGGLQREIPKLPEVRPIAPAATSPTGLPAVQRIAPLQREVPKRAVSLAEWRKDMKRKAGACGPGMAPKFAPYAETWAEYTCEPSAADILASKDRDERRENAGLPPATAKEVPALPPARATSRISERAASPEEMPIRPSDYPSLPRVQRVAPQREEREPPSPKHDAREAKAREESTFEKPAKRKVSLAEWQADMRRKMAQNNCPPGKGPAFQPYEENWAEYTCVADILAAKDAQPSVAAPKPSAKPASQKPVSMISTNIIKPGSERLDEIEKGSELWVRDAVTSKDSQKIQDAADTIRDQFPKAAKALDKHAFELRASAMKAAKKQGLPTDPVKLVQATKATSDPKKLLAASAALKAQNKPKTAEQVKGKAKVEAAKQGIEIVDAKKAGELVAQAQKETDIEKLDGLKDKLYRTGNASYADKVETRIQSLLKSQRERSAQALKDNGKVVTPTDARRAAEVKAAEAKKQVEALAKAEADRKKQVEEQKKKDLASLEKKMAVEPGYTRISTDKVTKIFPTVQRKSDVDEAKKKAEEAKKLADSKAKADKSKGEAQAKAEKSKADKLKADAEKLRRVAEAETERKRKIAQEVTKKLSDTDPTGGLNLDKQASKKPDAKKPKYSVTIPFDEIKVTTKPKISGDIPDGPIELVSPMPETDNNGWAAFVKAMLAGKPNTVTPTYGLGMFGFGMRRLADYGLVDNVRRVDFHGNAVWAGDWNEPYSLQSFLGNRQLQYEVFKTDMENKAQYIKESGAVGHVIDGKPATLSGLLAVAFKTTEQSFRSWLANPEQRKQFASTTAAFEKSNGIF